MPDRPQITDAWINVPLYTADEVRAIPTLVSICEFFGRDVDMLTERTLDQLLVEMDANGVDRGLLTGTPQGRAGGEFGPMSIDYRQALDYCGRSEDRLRFAFQLDSVEHITRTTGLLRELAADDAVALVRVIPSAVERDIDDRLLYHVYATCEELRLPVSINVGVFGPKRPSRHQDPILVEDVLIDFPDLVVCGGHMGHPYEKLLIRLMRKFENLHLMTSAFSVKYLEPEVLAFMNTTAGRDRLIFGSDWPILTYETAVPPALALPLRNEATRAAYLGGNIARVVGRA